MIDHRRVERIASRLLHSLRHELGLPRRIADALKQDSPLVVADMDCKPSYWLVPLTVGDRLAGFIRLSTEGDLLSHGRFGQGQNLVDLPPLSYLSREEADKELKANFGSGYQNMTAASLVHDGPPERIAWMSIGESADDLRTLLFWTFGSSYSRSAHETVGDARLHVKVSPSGS